MKKYILLLLPICLTTSVYADVICFEPKKTEHETLLLEAEKKKICIDVGDGNKPIAIGGSGDCGGSSACGSNSQEIPKMLRDFSNELELLKQDYNLKIERSND
jgi:hypothetical protein